MKFFAFFFRGKTRVGGAKWVVIGGFCLGIYGIFWYRWKEELLAVILRLFL
jgi:hypothetical protein